MQSNDWRELLRQPTLGDHIVQVYQDDDFLCDAVAEYMIPGLLGGEGAIVIARPGHAAALERALRAAGIDVASARSRGQLVCLDAAETLESFMQGDAPQWPAFHAALGGAIAAMRLDYPKVRAYGEMVDILWQDGRRDAALRLEEYWNELARLQTFSLLCAYRMDNLDAGSYSGPLECVCKVHSHLIPARDYGRLDEAVAAVAHEVLDESLAGMMLSLAAARRPGAEMPLGQAALLWLKQNMPLTANKILAGVRARC